ncbi:MAG TPA: DUF3820 family protein [Treponemataceae bacterium]|nr:DUF3820 family protein [Treponemataceae bacterium]HPS43384.1 DUF3820 family protein [Treponemataceae bacterium]
MTPPDDPPERYVPPFDPSGYSDPACGSNVPTGDAEELAELANARMPFGKYSGSLLLDLPETYVLWFKGKGYPSGKLGDQLRAIEEIKVNGLEFLLRPLVRQ